MGRPGRNFSFATSRRMLMRDAVQASGMKRRTTDRDGIQKNPELLTPPLVYFNAHGNTRHANTAK